MNILYTLSRWVSSLYRIIWVSKESNIYSVFPVQLITNPILLYTVGIIKVFIEIDEFIINLEPYRIIKYVILIHTISETTGTSSKTEML